MLHPPHLRALPASMATWFGVAVLGCAGWASAQASAEDALRASIPIRIVYEAPPNCPSDARLFTLIARRTPRVRHAAPDESARTFRVKLAVDSVVLAQTRATIQESAASGEMTRRLVGATCEEAADAAAFVVAVLADPSATNASAANQAPPPPVPSQPTNEPWVSGRSARVSASTPPSVSVPVSQHVEPRGGSWFVGYESFAVVGPAPGSVPGLRAFIEVRASDRAPSTGVMFAWRGSGAFARTSTLRAAEGLAQLSWTTGRLDFCATTRIAPRWSASPCAAFEAGALRGTGFSTRAPRSQSALWAAPAVLGRVTWAVVGPFALEVELGLSFPLSRPTFYFQATDGAQSTLHRVPGVVGQAGLGMGVRFP